MTNTLNPSIVPLIQGLFPSAYPDRGSLLVPFLQAWQAYTESANSAAATTLYARGFPDFRDVDSATEQFLVLLRAKYLDGIMLGTETDSRLLLKHAKDLYSAKGTPRGLKLFFRLLYDEAISLYYPKDDLMKLSSGTWTEPTYLELSILPTNDGLFGKAVIGLASGATGFVDEIDQRVMAGRLAQTAYVSAVTGQFQTGELVQPVDGSIPISECPRIVGSMNQLVFGTAGSGADYEVGDVVPVNSPHGVLGEALVTGTVDKSGIIDLQLDSDGYGYTNATQVVVSDTVVVVSGVAQSNNYARRYFWFEEPVSQPQALYWFSGANGTIAAGANVYAWSNSTTISGTAVVLEATYSNSTAGSLLVATTNGSVNAASLFTQANAIGISKGANGYVDQTQTGWAVGTANCTLTFSSNDGTFVPGEVLVQNNPLWPSDGAVIGSGTVFSVSNTFVTIAGRRGVFQPGTVTGQTSGATGVVESVAVTLGIVTTGAHSWTDLPGNFLYGVNGANGSVSFLGSAITAEFGVSGFTDTEVVLLNTDTLASIASAPLAGPYGLAANASANATTLLSTCLTFANATVGAVTGFYTIEPGQQVDAQPLAVAFDPRIGTLNSYDLTAYYADATASFQVGESVTQSATNARGRVTSVVNSSVMTITNERLYSSQQFVASNSSPSTLIVGGQSGATANVTGLWADGDDGPTGRDAVITANTASSTGAVSSAAVLDSGFGYVEGEQVWLGPGSVATQNSAYAVVQLDTMGTGRGSYTQNGGFMSDVKVLFDGDYWQEFSYEIGSRHQLSAYIDTLKRIMHPAGMRAFGRYVKSAVLDTAVSTPGGALQRNG